MTRFRYALAAVLASLMLGPVPAAASKTKAHHEQSDKHSSAKSSQKDTGRKAARQEASHSERSTGRSERSGKGKEPSAKDKSARTGRGRGDRKESKASESRNDSRKSDKADTKGKRGRNDSSEDRGASRETGVRCTSKRIKQGKKTRTVKMCEKPEPVLQSPIRNTNIEKPAPEGKEPEVKARSAPERAYAVDGTTFFFQGRKYRATGISGEEGGEMSKQRLQRALDAGPLSVEALSVDDSGVSTANVKVNGRNLKEILPLN